MAIPVPVKGIKVFNLLTNRSFKIIWDVNPVGETITKYSVYRSEQSYNGFVKLGDTLVPDLQYIDTTIPFTFDRVWYYKVTATNADGESVIGLTQAMTDFDYFAFQKPPVVLDFQADLIRWVYGEVSTGLVNSVNTTYYTKGNFKPKSLSVYKAGLKVLPSDYVELTPNSFQLSTAPTTGNTIATDYIKF